MLKNFVLKKLKKFCYKILVLKKLLLINNPPFTLRSPQSKNEVTAPSPFKHDRCWYRKKSLVLTGKLKSAEALFATRLLRHVAVESAVTVSQVTNEGGVSAENVLNSSKQQVESRLEL